MVDIPLDNLFIAAIKVNWPPFARFLLFLPRTQCNLPETVLTIEPKSVLLNPFLLGSSEVFLQIDKGFPRLSIYDRLFFGGRECVCVFISFLHRPKTLLVSGLFPINKYVPSGFFAS